MWRNFGWTAVLATWTIFLILNSGLAGEQISNNPRINNGHTSHEAYPKATSPDFDKKTIGDPTLRYAKEIFTSYDHSSAHKQVISRELKNMDMRDFNGFEERIVMSDAATTPQHAHGRDRRNARLTAKRVTAENMWSPRIITLEKLRNTRYRKFVSSTSSRTSQEQKAATRKRKRKARTIRAFSDGREEAKVKRDARIKDKEGESRHGSERVFNGENGAIAFFSDKFTKRPTNEPDSFIRQFGNSGTSKFVTLENTESEYTAEKREHNKKEGDARRTLELTKDESANELIYVKTNGGLQTATSAKCPSSGETQRREDGEIVAGATNDAIARNPSYGRSTTDLCATLIFDSSRVPNGEENAMSSRYRSTKDERSKSYKADGESLLDETYKRRGGRHSEVGFKVNIDRSEAEDIEDSFTSRAPNPSDNYLDGIGFAERSLLRRRASALRTARSTSVRLREYRHSLIYDSGTTVSGKTSTSLGESRAKGRTARMDVAADADNDMRDALETVRDVLPTNSSAKQIDETELEHPDMSARISVTQRRNPMHVRHVKSGIDRERQRATDDAVARIGLRNVPVHSSRLAKFESAFRRKAHDRLKYSAEFDVPRSTGSRPSRVVADASTKRDAALQTTSAEDESILTDASIIADNSTGERKINERALSRSELVDESVVENVSAITNRGRRDRGDARKGSCFHARGNGIRDTEEYRRYKRRETRSASGSSASTERDSEIRRALDAIRTATPLTANPSISAIETSAANRRSANAGEFLTPAGTSPSTRRRESERERRSTLPMDNDYGRYTSIPTRMGSDSLERPLIDDPRMPVVHAVETFSLGMLDRYATVTKIDNSVIAKEARTASARATLRERAVTSASVLDAPSIEPINPRRGYRGFANESMIDLLSQRNGEPSRDVFENDTTTENTGDSSSTDAAILNQWPVKHSAVVEGDLVLGGLMMVHEREDTITCGPVMPQGGVQALEAMLYTLDRLNDREIVPGVKIGAHILDDCDKDTYGLEMAVDFIKGMYARYINARESIAGASYVINAHAITYSESGSKGSDLAYKFQV